MSTANSPTAMSTANSLHWATSLHNQTDGLSSLIGRARCEAQLAKRDCVQSRQLLSELQRRVEATDGCRQRETRRMIKLETAEGHSSDLQRLVGTLAWQEKSRTKSPAVRAAAPGTLAWYRTLHSASQGGARNCTSPRATTANIIAGLEPVAGKVEDQGQRTLPHGPPPHCQFVAAGAAPAAKQAIAYAKAGPMDDGAQSDAESDTCSEDSEASSTWSSSASGSNAGVEVCSDHTAPDAGKQVFGSNVVADLVCAESAPRCSRPEPPAMERSRVST